MIASHVGGTKRQSSSIPSEDVSPSKKQRHKQRLTFRPVQNVWIMGEECQRKMKPSVTMTTADRPAATTTVTKTIVDLPATSTTADATTVNRPTATITTSCLTAAATANIQAVKIVGISEAAAKTMTARDRSNGSRHVQRYPPPFPRVPPHGLDPSWRKVPLAPEVSASRTGLNSVSVMWEGGRVRCGQGYRSDSKVSADISSYELYVCQETEAPPNMEMWHFTGRNLSPLPLPMVCDIEGLPAGHRYHFAVRPVDVHERRGPFGLSDVQL